MKVLFILAKYFRLRSKNELDFQGFLKRFKLPFEILQNCKKILLINNFLHLFRLISPASPLVHHGAPGVGRVVSPPYMLAAPGGMAVKSPLSATGTTVGEIDSGIDSLLTSLSDTSSNYSHRRMISPR